jgi:hypothetical protein
MEDLWNARAGLGHCLRVAVRRRGHCDGGGATEDWINGADCTRCLRQKVGQEIRRFVIFDLG